MQYYLTKTISNHQNQIYLGIKANNTCKRLDLSHFRLIRIINLYKMVFLPPD